MRGGGAYARDKNTSAKLCAKIVERAYTRGGTYLWDTTVYIYNMYLMVDSIHDNIRSQVGALPDHTPVA